MFSRTTPGDRTAPEHDPLHLRIATAVMVLGLIAGGVAVVWRDMGQPERPAADRRGRAGRRAQPGAAQAALGHADPGRVGQCRPAPAQRGGRRLPSGVLPGRAGHPVARRGRQPDLGGERLAPARSPDADPGGGGTSRPGRPAAPRGQRGRPGPGRRRCRGPAWPGGSHEHDPATGRPAGGELPGRARRAGLGGRPPGPGSGAVPPRRRGGRTVLAGQRDQAAAAPGDVRRPAPGWSPRTCSSA